MNQIVQYNFNYVLSAGGRNWIQVLCNCGPATLIAIMYMLDCGIGELPLDFNLNYHASWLSMGVLGNYFAVNFEKNV